MEVRMSDLVKRLWLHDCEGITREAADRIEELEAKLAVAVTHFKKLRRRQYSIETFDAVVNEIVEAALAELTSSEAADNEVKGGKDE